MVYYPTNGALLLNNGNPLFMQISSSFHFFPMKIFGGGAVHKIRLVYQEQEINSTECFSHFYNA